MGGLGAAGRASRSHIPPTQALIPGSMEQPAVLDQRDGLSVEDAQIVQQPCAQAPTLPPEAQQLSDIFDNEDECLHREWADFRLHAGVVVHPSTNVGICVDKFQSSGRPALLSLLKALGIEKLSDRQKLATVLGKASRPHAIIDASEAGDDRALRCALQAQPNANLDALGGAGGVTALMAAVSGDHRACAGLLLAAAADPDATRSIGLTALHIASIRGHDECVALLSVSAAVEQTDEDGWSSLMYAALHGHAECVRTLLLARANVNATKANGFSTLMGAATAGSVACVRLLCGARASVNTVSTRGKGTWTALDYARAFHHDCVLESELEGSLAASHQLPPDARSMKPASYNSLLSISIDDVDHAGTQRAQVGMHAAHRNATEHTGSASESWPQFTSEGCVIFDVAGCEGHAHDESWRERPVRRAGRAAPDVGYWCGSRYSHDTNVLQVGMRPHPNPPFAPPPRVQSGLHLRLIRVQLCSRFARAIHTHSPRPFCALPGVYTPQPSASADAHQASGIKPRRLALADPSDELAHSQVVLRDHGVRRLETMEDAVACGSLLWATGQPVDAALVARLRPDQRVNKFPGAKDALSLKQGLWRSVRALERRHGRDVVGFMPPTYLLPEERSELLTAMKAQACSGQPAFDGEGRAHQDAWWAAGVRCRPMVARAGSIDGVERLDTHSGGDGSDGGGGGGGSGGGGSDTGDGDGLEGGKAVASGSKSGLDNDCRQGRATRSVWIFKPAASRCGLGIQLHDAISFLPETLEEDFRGVASAYIDPPYLVDGLKFDLRLYVLVTRWRPLTAYTHTSGIVRFATTPYGEAGLGARRAHLTNYAVNKTADRFVRSTGDAAEAGGCGGSIWSLAALKSRLKHDLGAARATQVWREVDDVIVKTLCAATPAMCDACPPTGGSDPRCFQLFGFDVLLDADARPWLLEVNGDPGIRTESPIFMAINAPMVADLLNLIGVRALSSDGSSSDAVASARFVAVEAEARQYEQQQGWRRLLPSDRSQEYACFLDEKGGDVPIRNGMPSPAGGHVQARPAERVPSKPEHDGRGASQETSTGPALALLAQCLSHLAAPEPPPHTGDERNGQHDPLTTVLGDEDLLHSILSFLPPPSLLSCARVGARFCAAARQEGLWLRLRREQRSAHVPWSPLTKQMEAEARDAPDFRGWADEYRRACEMEDRGLYGVPVWTTGRNRAPDWPALVASHQMLPSSKASHQHARPSAGRTPPFEPPDASTDVCVRLIGAAEVRYCFSESPLPWEVGLAAWRARRESATSALESDGRALARDAAVEELLAVLKEGADVDERYPDLCKMEVVESLTDFLTS